MHVTVSTSKTIIIFHKILNYMPVQGSSYATETLHSSWKGEGGKGYIQSSSIRQGEQKNQLCVFSYS